MDAATNINVVQIQNGPYLSTIMVSSRLHAIEHFPSKVKKTGNILFLDHQYFI